MTLREFLLHHTKVNDFIIIRDGGWRIGCTIIDHEDLFIRSLSPHILDQEVKGTSEEVDQILFQVKVTYVDI